MKMTNSNLSLHGIVSKLKMLTVEPFIFFVYLGYALKVAPFQSLLMDRACSNLLEYSDDVCRNLDKHNAEHESSIEYGNNLYTGVMLVNSLPSMVVAIFVGPWSDKYTRKYPLVIASLGLFLEGVCTVLLASIPEAPPYWYIATSIFSGITGGFIISNSAAFSYLSDITDERSRPVRFAVLEFSSLCSIIIGSQVSGHVYDAFGYVPVLSVVPCFYGIALFYVIFFVPEIKPPVAKEDRLTMFTDLFRLDNIKMSYATCSRKRPGNLRLQIWLLIWIGVCHKFTDMGIIAIAFPFCKHMYLWDVMNFSNALTVFYVVNAAVTAGFVPILVNRLKLHEAALGLIGILSFVAKMIITSVAVYSELFFYGFIAGSLSTCSTIAVKSRLSKLVHKEELGRVFSLLGTFESVTPLLGSLVFLQVFNASLKVQFPGLAFAASGLLLVPCGIIFMWMMRMPTISLTEFARKEDEARKSSALEPIAEPSENYYLKLENETL